MSSSSIRAVWIAIGALFLLAIVSAVVALGGGAGGGAGGSGKGAGYHAPAQAALGAANAHAPNASVVSKTPQPAAAEPPMAAGPAPSAKRVKKPQSAPLAPATTTTTRSETTRAAANPGDAGIPQNNGGDSDPDNNGEPSDDDGAI